MYLHLENIERTIMVSNQLQKTIFKQKTEGSIPCKSRTPSGPPFPSNGPLVHPPRQQYNAGIHGQDYGV